MGLMPTIIYFLLATENFILHQVGKEGSISYLKETFCGNFPGPKIIPTTETEPVSIICSLKSKNFIRLQ
jgi:hypothetical protein